MVPQSESELKSKIEKLGRPYPSELEAEVRDGAVKVDVNDWQAIGGEGIGEDIFKAACSKIYSYNRENKNEITRMDIHLSFPQGKEELVRKFFEDQIGAELVEFKNGGEDIHARYDF